MSAKVAEFKTTDMGQPSMMAVGPFVSMETLMAETCPVCGAALTPHFVPVFYKVCANGHEFQPGDAAVYQGPVNW